ncbi:hypothetical protein BDE36_1896 [Arcticibacter tournemirensis]|nr:hypothetical protein BDE36_1896 [Arcticibacter tournemirensis]
MTDIAPIHNRLTINKAFRLTIHFAVLSTIISQTDPFNILIKLHEIFY